MKPKTVLSAREKKYRKECREELESILNRLDSKKYDVLDVTMEECVHLAAQYLFRAFGCNDMAIVSNRDFLLIPVVREELIELIKSGKSISCMLWNDRADERRRNEVEKIQGEGI